MSRVTALLAFPTRRCTCRRAHHLRRSTGPPIAQIVCRDGSKVGCRAYKPARGSEGRISVKLARILFRRRVNHRQMLPLLRLFRLAVLQSWGVVACILTHLTRPRRFVLDVLRPRWDSRAGHNSHSIVPTASTRRATSFPNFAYSPVCRVVRKSRVSGQRAVCSVRTTLREYKACALYTVFSGV